MMPRRTPIRITAAVAAVLALAALGPAAEASAPRPAVADAVLDRALQHFVSTDRRPPGIAVVVHRGQQLALHTAGVANVATGRPIRIDDHMRLASVAKAFSGAASLSLVADGLLSLDTTIGESRPDLPPHWWAVTLRQLLNHTSGIPDFTGSEAFLSALFANLHSPPPPRQLLSFVADEPLLFPPGSEYRYSNSDNIVVGLMVQAATGQRYEEVLEERVFDPLGLTRTSLPRGAGLPPPYVHGYTVDPVEDVSHLFAAGWSWASGGIVSTPRDADSFIRGYARGATTDAATRAAQFQFIDGAHSEPPGPGRNSAGLAIFRYETSCGTVYGHTGNTAGYTHFVAATVDGTRSTTVSVNAQVTPGNDPVRFPELHRIFEFAVCAAMAGT